MPIQPNFLERIAFFTFNAAPTPMLDLAGALAYQVVSTAVQLNIFRELHKRPFTAPELAQTLPADERGLTSLLKALEALGYVVEKNGRFSNTPMTTKWFIDSGVLDLNAATTCWDYFLQNLWPQAAGIVQSGERPFDFYGIMDNKPDLSHNFQQMMIGNINVIGLEVLKQPDVPQTATRLLDVGGSYSAASILFCQAYPQLEAIVLDREMALKTAAQNVTAAGLNGRFSLHAADLWQADWGSSNDIILLFGLMHHFDLDTNRKLLQKAYAALKSGGQVVIFEQVEGSIFGSAVTAIVRLVGFMYYLFANGRIFTRDEMTDLLNAANFNNIRLHPLHQAPGNSLVIAQK
ncbi:MAG: methyltransferase [Chloroflexota bacterium]